MWSVSEETCLVRRHTALLVLDTTFVAGMPEMARHLSQIGSIEGDLVDQSVNIAICSNRFRILHAERRFAATKTGPSHGGFRIYAHQAIPRYDFGLRGLSLGGAPNVARAMVAFVPG